MLGQLGLGVEPLELAGDDGVLNLLAGLLNLVPGLQNVVAGVLNDVSGLLNYVAVRYRVEGLLRTMVEEVPAVVVVVVVSAGEAPASAVAAVEVGLQQQLVHR